MALEMNGNKMVPMCKDSIGGVSVICMRKAAPSGGFQWYTHYKNDTVGTINTVSTFKEVFPNQYNEGYEVIRSNPRTEALVYVGNVGTLLHTPSLSNRPCAGHINGTGNTRAENAEYSNGIFTPMTSGINNSYKLMRYTTNNEVSWPTSNYYRLNVENSFYQSGDPFKFSAYAYYLLNVYNMPLTLDSNPFLWKICSSYKTGGVPSYGENDCTQDVTTHKVIDAVGCQTWLIKSKNTSNYLLKQDNPYQSSFADFLYNLAWIDLPRLKISVTTSEGWFQVASVGMEFWCYQHS